jgi:nucleoside-diphosphate-sugar epimerase
MKVLVTGATGFVGSHLVRALLRRGESVRILSRTASRAASLRAAGAEVRLGDLGEPQTLSGIAEGANVIFHLGSALRASADLFDRVDVQGTRRLLADAERAGVGRFVYAGSLSGYHLVERGNGSLIDELCPLDDTGLLGNYARAKSCCDEAVLAANRFGRMEGVVVRLGLVCGPGTNVLPPHVGKSIARNWVALFGDGGVPLPLTFVDNAVDALILAAVVPGIAGEPFNIVDDDVLTQRDYLELLRQCTGGMPHVLRLPLSAYYLLGQLTEWAAALGGKEPETTRHRIRNRLTRVTWDCSKAARMLQWQPRVPLRDGLARTFRTYASRGSSD